MSFLLGASRAKGVLDLIHSNVFGLVSIPSLGGSQYYVSFIDEFLIMAWLYFLKQKLEGLGMFKEFKALVENQTRMKIKVPRIDNGGEFHGKEFDQFNRQHEITR